MMIKFEFVVVIVKDVELSNVVVECVLNFVLENIKKIVVKGGIIMLVGFGLFLLGKCVVCMGCNLCIGEVIKILVIKIVKFMVGKGFKDVVNKKK